MIKRIIKITGVGTFSDFGNGGRFQFEKLTFIHGLNCYGKSTLCDVFRSFSQDYPELLKKRKTINPKVKKSQKVELAFDLNNKENKAVFQNNAWNKNGFSEIIEVFDARFINDNIFTGLGISRTNKENITDFILGEESVRLAKELESLNQKNRKIKKILKVKIDTLEKLIPHFGVEKFVKLNVEEELSGISKSLSTLNSKKIKLEKNIKEADKIIDKLEPPDLKLKVDAMELFEKVNKLLKKSFEDISEEATEKIAKHIEVNFYQKDGLEERWIKQGLTNYCNISQLEKSNCPLCGQSLQNSLDLIKAYQDYFNEEYNSFIENLEVKLDEYLREILSEKISTNVQLKDNLLLLKEYESRLENSTFSANLKEVEKMAKEFDNLIKTYDNELKRTIDLLKKTIELKIQKPHIAITEFNYSKLKDISESLSKVFVKINEVYLVLKKDITGFKNSFKTTQKQTELAEIVQNIGDFEIKKHRIENDLTCSEIKGLWIEMSTLETETEIKSKELENQQNVYLENYFEKINYFFKKFGSDDYKIEKDISKKGNKPVVALKIKFKDKPITDNQLSYVFSESDRRALALSIFWAKIDTKNNNEKENTIIVLDDPITSFDTNRMTRTLHETQKILDSVEQIIILFHYDAYFKHFFEKTGETASPQLLCIKKDANTSFIENLDAKKFCQTTHDKVFYNIISFINREHENDIVKDLRVYLENELKNRFKKQIIDNGFGNLALKDLSYSLLESGYINQSVNQRLEDFRQLLNPEHHIFTSNNSEDRITIAEDLINFVYFQLSPS